MSPCVLSPSVFLASGVFGNKERSLSVAPEYLRYFQCIGSDCDDTCCIGFNRVSVDAQALERFRSIAQPAIRESILAQIVADDENETDCCAYFKSGDSKRCPFLDARHLCEIHAQLGESFLSDTCAMYPRVHNIVDGCHEHSASLACPEVARFVLLDHRPIVFEESKALPCRWDTVVHAHVTTGTLDGRGVLRSFHELREFSVEVLRARTVTLSQRLALLVEFFSQLDDQWQRQPSSGVGDLIELHRARLQKLGSDAPSGAGLRIEDAVKQVTLLMQLIEGGMLYDGIAPRFRECVAEMAAQLGMSNPCSLEAVASIYARRWERVQRWMYKKYPFLFENYFVHKVFSRMFPISRTGTALDELTLMCVEFCVLRLLLAGVNVDEEGVLLADAQLIKPFQSYAKSFDHNPAYSQIVVEFVKANGWKGHESLLSLVA